jgi:hypothetical protein
MKADTGFFEEALARESIRESGLRGISVTLWERLATKSDTWRK